MRRKRQPSQGSPSPAPRGWRRFSGLNLRTLGGAVFLAGIIFIVYLPSLSSGFILDDDKLVTDNSCVLAPDGLHRIWFTAEPLDYWPVTNSMLWIEWRLWGMHPLGYHLVNVALHAAAALLIWSILRKLSIPGAFLAALLFAVHPVNVESVAWIAQRKDALAIVFFLLSILWYLKADKQVEGRASRVESRDGRVSSRLSSFNFGWYFLSLFAFLLAMLSKGSVAMTPVLLLGITWWRRKLTERDLLRMAPFFVIAAVLAYVNVWFQHHHAGDIRTDTGLLERLLGAGAVIWFYLYKAILPINLRFIYPLRDIPTTFVWSLPLIAAVLVTAALVGAVFWGKRNGWPRSLLFAWGFFCVSLIPVMGLADVGYMEHSLVADHYQHIAIIAVVALAGAGWALLNGRLGAIGKNAALQAEALPADRLRALNAPAEDPGDGQAGFFTFLAPQWQWMTYGLAILVVGTLCVLSWRQNERFQDPIALYQDAVKYVPGCWLIQNNLGICLADEADRLDAKGDHPAAAKYREEAIEHYRTTIRYNKEYFMAYNNLANALGRAGRLEESLPWFSVALDRYRRDFNHNPRNPEFRKLTGQVENNLAHALVQLGRLPEAIEHYQQGVALLPDAELIRVNFADALARSNQLKEAGEQLQAAIKIAPNHPAHRWNLGRILAAQGLHQQAISCFQETIRIQPNFLDAYLSLAETYATLGQTAEAIAAAQKGLEKARATGQTAAVEIFKRWLSAATAPPPEMPRATPPDESGSPIR
jgi:protein O-mannosyl-transferase